MSIFSKIKYFYLLLVLFSVSYSHAQDKDYSPEFVDSFLIQNSHDAEISDIVGKIDHAKVRENTIWDVQKLKKERSSPAMLLGIPIIIILLLFLKFGFKDFYLSCFSGLLNDKVFQLRYRNMRVSELLPILLVFLIRSIALVLIGQFFLYHLLGEKIFLSVESMIVGIAFTTLFFSVKYFLEYLSMSIIGVSDKFKIYFTQHFILNTWLILPFILVILVVYLNSFHLNSQIITFVFILPIAIIFGFSIIRAMILWKGVWKDYLIYFFMYLCTFKIIPYLILMKIVQDFWLKV
ncbi:MAG: DUF4271 domain-containing protein [Chitinophagales bacterium]|nr:DUF4271 domain-containing protein [Chitinophagales bacterium]MCZ2392679.1 DUF4271 domain-containing protein [Chitinophagales bacterium]